jgi:quinoprotein glucose dehydrogenase
MSPGLRMTRCLVPSIVLLAVVAGSIVVATRQAPARDYRTWSAYGGGPEQLRYSSLDQINRGNAKQLQVAWTWDSGESGGLQTQPLVVDGVVFAYTPTHKTVAIDGATGQLKWMFDSGIRGQGPNRGFMYWAGGSDRRLFSAVDQFLYALDPATGRPIPGFGIDGRIDLREGLGRPAGQQNVRLTSPGVVYRDLFIVGGRVSEGLPASPGDVRAFDVRTGALRWRFRTIPDPGEFGHDTWSADSYLVNGGANNWAGMALDDARGIVYVPTGSASSDFYGANRVGDNLFANSLVALEAATGRRLWHFQFVKHDIWDRDLPSPPTLLTVQRNGRPIDAVAQTTKHGYVFVFDRVTGEPLFPFEQRPFPKSDVPGEVAAATQPIPLLPKPFARQQLTEDLLTSRTPVARAWALEQFKTFRNDGQFLPFAVDRQTVVFPGFDGGAEWGGAAGDPTTGMLYVNANDLAWTGGLALNNVGQNARDVYLRECASCHRDDLQGTPPAIASLVGIGERRQAADVTRAIQQGAGRMPGFPNLGPQATQALVRYLTTGEDGPAGPSGAAPTDLAYRFTGYRKFLDPDGYPAVAPPWGTLSAIDLNTGEYAWQIPFGEYPELVAQGLRNTGSENYGGPIVTAGGLVFIAASNHDRKFRAFDKATGELLYEAIMPFSGNATPATYEVNGRQFVVVAAGSGKTRGASGGMYVAFSLPPSQ